MQQAHTSSSPYHHRSELKGDRKRHWAQFVRRNMASNLHGRAEHPSSYANRVVVCSRHPQAHRQKQEAATGPLHTLAAAMRQVVGVGGMHCMQCCCWPHSQRGWTAAAKHTRTATTTATPQTTP